MVKRVSTDAWVGRTTVPKGKVVVEEQEAFPSCTLPEGLQHIPLWRSSTSTAEEYHHSLFFLSFGVGCWLF